MTEERDTRANTIWSSLLTGETFEIQMQTPEAAPESVPEGTENGSEAIVIQIGGPRSGPAGAKRLSERARNNARIVRDWQLKGDKR